MQKIKCIIIEDEPLAVKILKDYVQQSPHLELMEVFRDAISAGLYLKQEKIDLMFLDIHLPILKGLEFLRTLPHPPIVIITTAYPEYALEGYELNVADFLMKPISFKRFTAAIHKAEKLIKADNYEALIGSAGTNAIYLNVNRRKVRILLNEILYVESKREYVQITTRSNEFISKIGTAEIELLLPPDKFRRIHRSFIISIDKIDTYTKENVEIQGQLIPIGKHFRKDFIASILRQDGF
jgi:DNA-binding LytR/AlgR family response regulator